jgi:hypothetical protein
MGIVGIGDTLVDFSRETQSDAERTICGKPTEPGHHGNTSVLEFCFTHPVKSRDTLSLFPARRLEESGKVLRDGGQVERIETNISYHGSIKVDRARQPWE